MPTEPSAPESHQHVDELVAERRRKLDWWRDRGRDPYPVAGPTKPLAELRTEWDESLEADEESDVVVTVGGRLVLRRGHGKLVFLVLRQRGAELQVMCQANVLGDAMAEVGELDLGDWVTATGPVIRTKRGELSVQATEVAIAAKALVPMPDKHHGLRDTEVRYRQRWADLAVNEDTRAAFEARAAIVSALRAELDERGYLEVETPILQPLPGGAAARPFVTHHNALDTELYLRIAPELYLKRLMAGGLDRVYEIGRVFRNEGLSPRHNPEFTMLESYEAFADYQDMMDLTEALVRRAARACGSEIDLGEAWPRRRMIDLVREATGEPDLSFDDPVDEVRALCKRHDVLVHAEWGAGKLVLELYEKLVEPGIVEPTFVIDYPVEVSPLARRHRDDPHVTERFELVVEGRELCNAFTELTDPDDQRARFEEQARAKAAGDDEAMVVDENYLSAMDFGMPPMGGLGIGVDRLVMLLTGRTAIRDVVLFPTLRPE